MNIGSPTEATNETCLSLFADRPGLAELYSRRIAPNSGWADMGASEHFVQFYESDHVIVDSVAEYVIHGLKSDETCIVAATREHLAEIERIINSFTSGLDIAQSEGRYIPLDAIDTLSRFMVDGMPDADLFASVIGELLEDTGQRGAKIRAFGEMVGVLFTKRNYAAAICLEDLWNELRTKYSFSLFCAYPMAGLNCGGAGAHMSQICDGHSRVIPDETYTSLTNSDDRLRAIAVLQQRSKQLEAEVAELEQRISLKQIGLQAA